MPHDFSPSPDYSAPLDKTGTGADERTAHAPRASTKIHHPRYKIVIAAAPDRAAAVRMASRVLSLGYASHIVPSQIDGQNMVPGAGRTLSDLDLSASDTGKVARSLSSALNHVAKGAIVWSNSCPGLGVHSRARPVLHWQLQLQLRG